MLKNKLLLLLISLVTLSSFSTAFAAAETQKPDWYWVHSDDYFNFYVDINSIRSYKDPATNIIHKKITEKLIFILSKDLSYNQEDLEFKSENGVNYYRILSISEYDSNENFVKLLYKIDEKRPSTLKWGKTNINEDLPKIADLLFEKN
jgi:hypothetical protein